MDAKERGAGPGPSALCLISWLVGYPCGPSGPSGTCGAQATVVAAGRPGSAELRLSVMSSATACIEGVVFSPTLLGFRLQSEVTLFLHGPAGLVKLGLQSE